MVIGLAVTHLFLLLLLLAVIAAAVALGILLAKMFPETPRTEKPKHKEPGEDWTYHSKPKSRFPQGRKLASRPLRRVRE